MMTVQLQNEGNDKLDATLKSPSSIPIVEEPGADMDVFKITPMEALKEMASHLTELVRITGDIPPTPMAQSNTSPEDPIDSVEVSIGKQSSTVGVTELHWAGAKNVAAHATLVGAAQQNALAKRFYSKKAPPISLEAYLLRLHKYCPMSTAVYLATSLYITRMVVEEKVLLATPRNVHRLVLAGLRVAMKALEDLSYPHARFARVGGVTERELSRLEVTFCFLIDFDLRVDAEALMCQARLLRDSSAVAQTNMCLNTLPLNAVHSGPAFISPPAVPKQITVGAPENQT
jgi:hypothetical protein